jgi:hypothetical protein
VSENNRGASFGVVAGALNGKWLERDSGMHLDCFKFLDRDFPIAERILTIANDDIIRRPGPPWL